MLRNTFLFLPRIGATLESRLWSHGITTWDAYEDAPEGSLPGIGETTREKHRPFLEAARQALPDDPRWFAEHLPAREHWRGLEELGKGAVYLDIETTGLGAWSDVTCVGFRGPRGTRVLVRGEDLTRDTLAHEIGDASLLVTFNGTTFDLPFLRQRGFAVPDVPHLDLRYALGRLGYSGGLKRIEVALGMAREGELEDVSGLDAVRLWRQWERRGDAEARRKLVAYNRADVENLVPLAELAYARLRDQTLGSGT